MTVFGPSFSEGQQVVVRRDLNGWLGPLGYPAVRRGARAIVRERPSGLFSDPYVVELTTGRRVAISARHLKPALFGGPGEGPWRRYKANRLGIRLGMGALSVPAVVGIIRFYLAGGTTAELVAALPGAILSAVAEVVSAAANLLGLPLFVLVVAGLWILRRSSS